MRTVTQRVRWARVKVDGETVGEIEHGLVVLLGVASGDDEARAQNMARKLAELRIFPDDQDRMNRSLLDVAGGCLVVSQFTLFADCRKGRRPYFGGAEEPSRASALCDTFVLAMRAAGVERVQRGRFGAMMQVELCNDGPVTIIMDSEDIEKTRRG